MAANTCTEPGSAGRIFTIGHSTRPIPEFVRLLRENEVTLLVDVRSVPRSRTNPQYNVDTLPETLAGVGIGHSHIRALGGLRHQPKGAPASPNTAWRNSAFRNYADYAMTPEFRAGLDQLCAMAAAERCAIMCAEAVWWRCHRRLVADNLLMRGYTVLHIMGPGKLDPARLTQGAEARPDGTLVYAATAPLADLFAGP